MHTLGNIIWFVFGGFIIFFEYLFSSLFLCFTIIEIPFGIQTFKLAIASVAPFGKEIVTTKKSNTALYIILNIIWLLLGGLVIALSHLIFGVIFFITIIGIPFGKQHFKLMRLSLTPFGFDLR